MGCGRTGGLKIRRLGRLHRTDDGCWGVVALAFRADVADGVSEGVATEVAVTSKDFAARVAFVGLQVGVSQQMRLQVGTLIEAAGADGALVRRFLQVKDPMDGQRPGLAESFAAITALERLLFRVNVAIRDNEKIPLV